MRFASNLGIQNSGAPNIKNAEGHPAHSEEWKQTVARIAFTGVLGDQYYGKEKEQAKEFIPVCLSAASKDPRFLFNAALASRAANFKLFPKIAVAALITTCGAKSFEKLEGEIVLLLSTYNAGQLLELALVLKTGLMGKKLGSRAQRVMGRALSAMSVNKLENMTLADRQDVRRLLRLLHPKGFNTEQARLFAYCLGDNPTPQTERQNAMELLKGGHWDQAKVIRDFNLPFNATKGFANADPATWTAIMENMSPLQLMLNLKALVERGVMKPAFLKEKLARVDMDRVRLVPHDVLRPMGMIHEVHQDQMQYREILTDFLARLASVSIPGLEDKRVGILLDFSGSMAPGYQRNSLGNWVLAVTLATGLSASCKERHLAFFGNNACWEGTTLQDHGRGTAFPYLKGAPPQVAFHNLLGLEPCYGTNISAGIQLFSKDDVEVDALFLFTDEQQNDGIGANAAWRQYRAKYPKAKLVVVNVSNTKWHIARETDPSVVIIQTVTPLIFKQFASFNQSAVQMIENWV